MNEYTKEDVAQELAILVKAGLIDIKMREDGEWLYFPTEYSKTLTEQELIIAIDKIKEDEE
jgi:DNA-binding transcriptional ArsR family regulator